MIRKLDEVSMPWSGRSSRELAKRGTISYLGSVNPNERHAIWKAAREARATSFRLLGTWEHWWRVWDRIHQAETAEQRWITVCAYCHRFQDTSGSWHELPPKVAERFNIGQPPQVTHGYCPDCVAKVSVG